MGWTFTMKLLVVRGCRSRLGQGLKTGFNRRTIIRCACYQRDSPEVLLVRPLSAINLSLPFSFCPLYSQVAQQLVSLYMAPHRKIWDVILSLSFSIRASITTCLSHVSAASRQTHTHTVPHQDIVKTTTSVDEKNKKQEKTDTHLTR